MTVLNLHNCGRLADKISIPQYQREAISPGIIHFGVGNFHRAHEAVYLNSLFNLEKRSCWGIIGAGTTPYDAAMREKLQWQDWLTSVTEQEQNGEKVTVTGSMIGFLNPEKSGEILQYMTNPFIRIISLTVTENGYYISGGKFDKNHADILYDSAHKNTPKTVFGLIVRALELRRQMNIPPFTVMSCDNIPMNGHATKNSVCGLAEMSSASLAKWIEENVSFPSSMVDRITPKTSEEALVHLKEKYGLEDKCGVFCEPFMQWIIEDNFVSGRPALEKAGVQFVKDILPYELMKLRILNGGHSAVAYAAELMDITYVHDAMTNPIIKNFLQNLIIREIIPTVPDVPGIDLNEYCNLIITRFSNPKIRDTVARLAMDGSSKLPKFTLPVIIENLKNGGQYQGLALVIALFFRYYRGISDSGRILIFSDAYAEELHKAARESVAAFLRLRHIFRDLADNTDFVNAVSDAVHVLNTEKTAAVLTKYSECGKA